MLGGLIYRATQKQAQCLRIIFNKNKMHVVLMSVKTFLFVEPGVAEFIGKYQNGTRLFIIHLDKLLIGSTQGAKIKKLKQTRIRHPLVGKTLSWNFMAGNVKTDRILVERYWAHTSVY